MKKLLVVEDDDSVRTLAARALERAGYAVDVATNGKAGLDKIEAAGGQYDLIISDVRMPGMDGIEMAKAAARSYPDIRILFVTGYADQRERAAELDSVVAGVLQKPFTLVEIRARVDRLLVVAA
ncbi:MAG TPA: response regulator [Rhizobiaceae bacterium]|nr:response regulator [Rhizobiaceae bacterium]